MIIKVGSKKPELPLHPIRISTPGWAGKPVKMEDGAPIQPLHCLPFVEGSTYGLELRFPYEKECHVVNDNGAPRFEWDFLNEPGESLGGGEFLFFSPIDHARYYLFNTRLDVQPPPGHVIRTEPHPRFFTDDTGNVPLAMIGHLQNEWYPRPLFIVFRVPRPGERHIFRKGEPYAQLLFVPHETKYEIARMTPEEEEARQTLMKNMQFARDAISTNRWYNSTNNEQDNHYKVLAAAFAKGGQAKVEETVREGVERQKHSLPHDRSIAECLAMAHQHLNLAHYQDARTLFFHVLSRDPNNGEAMSAAGICLAMMGNIPTGLQWMAQAAAIQPNSPKLHRDLGEMLRLSGKYPEAEAAIRNAIFLSPNNPELFSLLGLTLAQQDRLIEGLVACRTAVALDNMMPGTHYRLGYVLAKLGKKDEARASFAAAEALNANFPGPRFLGITQAQIDALLV